MSSGVTKNIANRSNIYRKYQLKSQIQRGFQNQSKDDLREAMSDFADYLTIVDFR